ncbi:hypothetical protein IP68_15310 [Blastomonas sp. AAP25]|uniref:helix-turn-helix domain-containing protein n=1 Tax=Blastomonas sp. AAP25 TaxID=1523416 RepID=UPI0006B9040C|nr:helix-turn-helix transcriptional regulator [Blastomonas sp. AAP25]KPF73894.1 hypothetical protein IP68_15310 [Blastomonas sp. AAP25]
MSSLLMSLESARKARHLRQTELAEMLEVTQGHYSKVVKGVVPLSASLEMRIRKWIDSQGVEFDEQDRARRMKELANSIHSQCVALMRLADIQSPDP